jgi:Domain of unknown function (DUF4124)
MKRIYVSTCLAGLLMAATAAQAQIVKCVGKDGKIEFASSCPSGTKQMETGVTSKPAPVPTQDAKAGDAKAGDTKAADKGGDAKKGPPTLAEREADYKKRQTEKAAADEKTAKSATDDARSRRACTDAQSYLKRLQERQRIVNVDPKTGERVYLNDADYPREMAVAQQSVSENCK